MNALQTFAQQIKEYGTFDRRVERLDLVLEYYKIDNETEASIFYDEHGNVEHASFGKIRCS